MAAWAAGAVSIGPEAPEDRCTTSPKLITPRWAINSRVTTCTEKGRFLRWRIALVRGRSDGGTIALLARAKDLNCFQRLGRGNTECLCYQRDGGAGETRSNKPCSSAVIVLRDRCAGLAHPMSTGNSTPWSFIVAPPCAQLDKPAPDCRSHLLSRVFTVLQASNNCIVG